MCADSTCPFYLAVSGRLAGEMLGKRNQRSQPWQLLRWRLGLKDMLLQLAQQGPAGDLKNMIEFFYPNSAAFLPTFRTNCPGGSHFAQMGSHFAQNTTTNQPLFFTQP